MAVVGFRRCNDTTGRQITAVVTESGYFHKSSGPLGKPGRYHCARDLRRFPPRPSDHPIQKSVALMRRLHGDKQHAYARVLIAPVMVRLEEGVDEASTSDVISSFTGAAPPGTSSLEDAISAFYRAIGAPVRPAPRAARAWSISAPRTPRADQYLRVLVQGAPVTTGRRGASCTVTPQAVRLDFTDRSELDRTQVLDLHAALTAWLRLNP
ncbi:hypothetical protein ABT071_34915 [Streptomyces sp. NPDC002506]|uniref:hypothetical protein n=1 Tax=Streptomyces sp. NPDC002506 TaxID=3154536 RepID=UPI00332F0100